MTQRSRMWATLLSVPLFLALAATGRAAELYILAGGAMAQPLQAVAPQFEQSSGHKLVFRYGTTPELVELAKSGTRFDLGVFPQAVLADAGARALFASAPPTDIARSGLGVAVRAGAPRPDIGTPAALKRTLLAARSIVTIPASATGAQLQRVFEQLGISEAMKEKTRAQPTPAKIVETVARGDGELAVFLMNVITAPGLDVVGPFPAEVQQEVVFTAAVAKHTGEARAAQSFIAYLTSPATVAVFKSQGLDR
jgi:molybdate transport system substrate-binding protein